MKKNDNISKELENIDLNFSINFEEIPKLI
jgi:hypothetical protein